MPIFILAGGFQPVLKRTLATKIRVNTLPDASQFIYRLPNFSPARKKANSSKLKGKGAGVSER